MPCTFNLFDQLTGNPSNGGTWTETTVGPPTYTGQGGTITGGDLGTVDFTGITAGTYTFEYEISSGPCAGTSMVTVTVVDGAQAGTDNSISYCNTDCTQYNLYDLLGTTPLPDTDGTWSVTPATPGHIPGTGVPTDDVFDACLAGNGVYTFTYTVDHSTANTPANCDNCVDTSTLVITVQAEPNSGENGNVTACN